MFKKILLIISCLFSCFITYSQICSKTQLPANLQNGLVAFYPFCGNANDASGNGNNGTILGASLTVDRFGITNNAFVINGIDCPSPQGISTPYLIDNKQSYSISIWFKSTDSIKRQQTIFNSSPHTTIGLSYNHGFAPQQVMPCIGIPNVGWTYCPSASSPLTNQLNWHHAVLVKDSFQLKLYIDGVLSTTKAIPQNINTGTFTLTFGASSINGGVNCYEVFKGSIDDGLIFNRAISPCEVSQLYNSTNNNVPQLQGISINALSDTTSVCGSSTILDAGAGFSTYKWSTGATTQTITPSSSGFYKVTVTNASGCTGSDSTYLSLVYAKILQKDTAICKGSSITLSIDSSFAGSTVCNVSQLTTSLRNGLVAYFPFCGNANDESGNANNGIAVGATLTTDRFGNSNNAYYFDGNNQYIAVNSNNLPRNDRTISVWINVPNSTYPGMLASYGGDGSCGSGYFIGINHRNTDKMMVSGHCGANETQFNYIPPQNTWVHLVFISSMSGTKSYINGNLIGSGPAFFSNTVGSKLFIGSSIDWLGINPYVDANGLRWLGKIDDFFLWNRAITEEEVKQLYSSQKSILWSTSATTSSITVSPTQTTKYYVTVSDGITSCQDSITVTVNDLSSFNPLQDTIRVCGDSVILDAGSGYSAYNWSNGETTQKITVKSGGKYIVNVSNASGCTSTDSTLVSIVKAKILQRDTTICKGSSIRLSVDSTSVGQTACNASQLPVNLRNGLVAYYPFCGNANDISGNGNNGNVNGATLGIDRFGNSGNSYSFNGINNYINIQNSSQLDLSGDEFTISVWVKNSGSQISDQFLIAKSNGGGNQNKWVFMTTNSDLIGNHPGLVFHTNPALSSDGNYWINSDLYNTKNVFWQYCVVTKTKNTLSLFINGLNVKNVPITNNLPISYNDLRIGGDEINGGGHWFRGNLDDLGIWSRALNSSEISQLYQTQNTVSWSNASVSNSITVSPTQTTKYYVTVSDGITSCQDSITVTVSDISSFNPLQDTIRVCGDSVILDAGSGYSSYNWNSGATTQKITVKSGGKYAVSVSNAIGCSASDSTLVSIVKAKIIQRDTTICKGSSIILSTDSTLTGSTACNISELPMNLRNGLVAYYPFCGNANDASGNGNNGTVNGATLSSDRFGISNNAYYFNGNAQYISVVSNNLPRNDRTVSAWINVPDPKHSGILTGYGGDGNCGTSYFIGLDHRNTNKLMVTGHCIANETQADYLTPSNTWVHLVCVSSLNGTKIYINGKLIATGPNFFSNTTGQNLYIGSSIDFAGINPYEDDACQRWIGKIDDFFLWNRAISEQEISQLYTTTKSILWSTGSTTSSITVSPTQTTKYYVTVSDGITSCMDSVIVTVAALDTSITALDPTSVCATGGNVRLQAGVANTYRWLKDGAVISGATARLYSATQTGSYRVVVTNTAGCTDTSRAISIILDPKPIPNFIINNNAQCLTENGFNFTNTSTISSGTMTYTWNLGEGTIVSTTDASKTYTAAGTYNIKLIATSNRQCVDSITKSITVYAQPAIPNITGADEFCKGSTITLSTNAPTTRQWYRNDAIISGAAGASLTIQQSGNYKVTTQNANGCVSESLVKIITENPLPQGSLNIPSSLFICEGTPYTLTASGGTTYQWYLNNVAIAGETSSTHTTGTPGNYKVEFVSDKGCRSMSTNTIDLTLIKAPDAAFSYDTYCVNVQTNFSSRSTTNLSGIVTYAWKFGDGKTAGNTTNTYNIYSRSGNFTATLLVTPTACPQLVDSAQAVIAIQDPTPGIQYPPVNVIINKSQQLNARNIGISYLWSPGLYLNSITSRTPVITTSKEQLYRILITNAAGCNTIDTQLVRVFPDRNIYVPEGFTPDNDGRNDKLYPITVGISEMKVFRIYNRWGLLVYDNKNANANTGWDGTYKGTKQPMETFAWVAEGIDIDGNYLRRTGNTILIR